jgi:hypothetical protein
VNYRPELRGIEVPLQKLLLDPNNPRFLEDHALRVDEKDFADSGVQDETAQRMRKDAFRLDELKKSIETNGWQPVDMIFVRRLEALPGQYVVLEGNRRLMALRDLKREGKLVRAMAAAVDPLHVLEVVGTTDVEESRAQITYLLGVRHHGSLKMWGPFAQAHNLYERYLQEGKMTSATFRWDERIAAKIGDRLSVEVKKIEERLRTYVAMKQLHEVPAINEIGMEGKFYSLVKEVLPPGQPRSPLREYVRQDATTFKLDDDSVTRLDHVCHFSTSERGRAPISSPDEWRSLAKILSDVDAEKRAAMLREVEVDKVAPSDVWAVRQAELRQPRWDRWLGEVAGLLRRLQIVNIDRDDSRAQKAAAQLAKILDTLPGQQQNSPAVKEQ